MSGVIGVVGRNALAGVWGCLPFWRPGGDLLSHVLGRSTIGAEGFHGRVRDGIGCIAPRNDHQVVEQPWTMLAPSRELDDARAFARAGRWIGIQFSGDRVNEVASCAGVALVLQRARSGAGPSIVQVICLSLRAMGNVDQADGAISTG